MCIFAAKILRINRMAREIFISYSREDKELVHPFAEYISRAVNRDCWIDLKGIESGEEFEEVIIEAINECQVVLFMLSDSSLRSKWTKREVYYAEGEGKRIVPVLVNGENLRGWFKFHFGNVDFINLLSKEQKEKLVRDLRSWLGVEQLGTEEKKAIGKAEAENKRKAEEVKREAEEARHKADEDAKRKVEEEERRKAKEEKRRVEEEAKRKAEAEARRKAEEEESINEDVEDFERVSLKPENYKEKHTNWEA